MEDLLTEEYEFEISRKRDRIGAFLIDFFIYWLIGFAMGAVWGTPAEEGVGFSLNGLPALAFFSVGLLLWPVSEKIWGQTIGKRALKIKVVNNQYLPISLGQAFTRFFLGFVDWMFFCGLIVAHKNEQNKRIGDLVANTIVTKTE